MRFFSPEWLWLVAAAPLTAALLVWAARRDAAALARVIARALWERVVAVPRPARAQLRGAVLVLSIVFAALALARPQWGLQETLVERQGVDVVVMIDTSVSMLAADVPPSRIFWARAAARAVLDALGGDRASLVAFEGEVRRLVPLTVDLSAIYANLDLVEPGIVSAPGTRLADALLAAPRFFPGGGRKYKAVVLISDGEDQDSDVASGIETCRKEGIIVHTIAIGSEEGGPIPLGRGGAPEYKRDEGGEVVISRMRAGTLREIAEKTGGEALAVHRGELDLAGIARAIQGMEKRKVAGRFYQNLEERFTWPLAAAVLLLALHLAVPAAGVPAAGSGSGRGKTTS